MEVKDSRAEILKEGARIKYLVLNGKEIIKANNPIGRSENAILFPFPNRIKDGMYIFEGKKYKLPINKHDENNAIHGYLYNKEFEIVNESEDSIHLRYQSNGIIGYPFKFTLDVIYSLGEDYLNVHTEIRNEGNDMPCGLGWHPYFLTKGERYIKMPSSELLIKKGNIPTGDTVSFTDYSTLSKIREHDDTFYLLACKSAEIILKDDDKTVSIIQETGDRKYNFVQIYTLNDRVAIEPMTCAPNAFNNKMGLIILRKNDSFNLEYKIKVS